MVNLPLPSSGVDIDTFKVTIDGVECEVTWRFNRVNEFWYVSVANYESKAVICDYSIVSFYVKAPSIRYPKNLTSVSVIGRTRTPSTSPFVRKF
jgi:hypothetical protein